MQPKRTRAQGIAGFTLLVLVFQLFGGMVSAQECPPGFYKSLPRENGEFYYGAGKGDDFNEARRVALDRLGDMAIGPNHAGGNAEYTRMRGWEQDDRADCKGKSFVLVRISKSQLAANIKEFAKAKPPATNAQPPSTPVVVKVVLPQQQFAPSKTELTPESGRTPHRDDASRFPIAWLLASSATLLAVFIGWFISHSHPNRTQAEAQIAEPSKSPPPIVISVEPTPVPIPQPSRPTPPPQSVTSGFTNEDRIIGELRKRQPMCDDCLSRDLSIFPRQQVNQICRRLEDKGILCRFKGVCVGQPGEFKIVNKLT